jgi:hypothetical protein
MKKLLLIAGLLAGSVLQAQNAPPASAGAGGPPMPGTDANLDQTPLFNEVDANHDGKATKAEWLAAGAPEMVWSIVDSDKNDVLTLDELKKSNPPPSAIDVNKDGKVNLAEMKNVQAAMGNGPGGAQSGAPPAGGPATAK